MSRLSIEISESQRQQIKAMAALRGISIKDYVLERTLSDENTAEAAALAELTSILKPRVAAARRGEVSKRSIKQVAALARRRRA